MKYILFSTLLIFLINCSYNYENEIDKAIKLSEEILIKPSLLRELYEFNLVNKDNIEESTVDFYVNTIKMYDLNNPDNKFYLKNKSFEKESKTIHLTYDFIPYDDVEYTFVFKVENGKIIIEDLMKKFNCGSI